MSKLTEEMVRSVYPDYSIREASKMLGVPRRTFRNAMTRYGIPVVQGPRGRHLFVPTEEQCIQAWEAHRTICGVARQLNISRKRAKKFVDRYCTTSRKTVSRPPQECSSIEEHWPFLNRPIDQVLDDLVKYGRPLRG